MTLLFVIIIPIVAFLATLLVRKSQRALTYIASSAALLELFVTVVAAASVIRNGVYSPNSYFALDALGTVVTILVALVGAAATWYSTGYLKVEVGKKIIGVSRVRQYFLLLHLFMLAMFFAVLTTNPIFMWIGVEATTLSTAFLISFYNKPSTMEAAWKYLIINSFGLLLGLFGTLLFLYPTVYSGFNGFVDWKILLADVGGFDPAIAKIAFVFIMIGFGTKVGLAPMHTWRPDAYSKAPIPIVTLLSGALLDVAFLAILRFKTITDLAVGKAFTGNVLIFFGLLSVVIAAMIIFTQRNYKRLLAYSSIEHAGIMALGFGFGGIGAFAALLHMIYHSLTKSVLFLSVGNVFLKYGSTKIKNIKGALAKLPVTGILLIIGFLAITGVPPFGIFITEFSILSVGIKHHPAVVIVALLALSLIFIGFLRHFAAMLFGNDDATITKGENSLWTLVPIIMLVAILIFLSLFIPADIHSLLTSATMNY